MNLLKQSTAATINLGPAISPADGYTLVSNLVGTGSGQLENTSNGVMLSKNGGTGAVRHATASASSWDVNIGCYKVILDTTDTNTLGRLRISFVPGTNAVAPMWRDYTVVPAAIYDALVGDNSLLGAMLSCGLVGTVTATGADATHIQLSDYTEATANHLRNKQAWMISGNLAKQCIGVVTDYALTGGQGRVTVGPGSPTNETPAVGDLVFIL